MLGVERYLGLHRFDKDYCPQVDRRKNRAFFRLVDRVYRRVFERCEVERAVAKIGSAGERESFRVATRGGLHYAPGQLTMEWEAYGRHDAKIWYEQFELKESIPYEDYLASELVLMYTTDHEGEDHVSVNVCQCQVRCMLVTCTRVRAVTVGRCRVNLHQCQGRCTVGYTCCTCRYSESHGFTIR